MSNNFHEQFTEEKIPLPTERSTGLVFAGVAVIVALFYRGSPTVLAVALGTAALFAAVSLLAPHVLKPLNIAWFKLALLLNKIVSPVVMLVLFAVTIVPFGLVAQLRFDPLRKKRDPESATYWIERSQDVAPSSMTNQY